MADTLSITLEVDDKGANAKLVSFVHNTEEASKKINDVGKKIDFSKPLISDLDKAESRIAQFTQRSNAVIGSFLGNLSANAVTKFTTAVISGGEAILDYSSNLEQAKNRFYDDDGFGGDCSNSFEGTAKIRPNHAV